MEGQAYCHAAKVPTRNDSAKPAVICALAPWLRLSCGNKPGRCQAGETQLGLEFVFGVCVEFLDTLDIFTEGYPQSYRTTVSNLQTQSDLGGLAFIETLNVEPTVPVGSVHTESFVER